MIFTVHLNRLIDENTPLEQSTIETCLQEAYHGRFVSFARVQSKASAASAPARVQSIIKHVHVTCFVHKRMLGVIAQPRIPAVLLCQEVSKKMATCIDKLASGVNLCLS